VSLRPLLSRPVQRVSIAAGSQAAADAGAGVADHGGNAVDAAIAASIVGMVTEPGIIAPGGSCFLTVWPPDGDPVVIDAYAAVPGIGGSLPDGDLGDRVSMAYGGGMETMVGPGSIAVPGAWAGLGAASGQYGALPWAALLAPAIEVGAAGFPLSGTSASYLSYAHGPIFDREPESKRALCHADTGTRLAEGEDVRIAGLADSLGVIADEGADTWYTGSIAEAMLADLGARGGHITRDDLAMYRAIERTPTFCDVDEWLVATNPAPAIGGAVLASMLVLLDDHPFTEWSRDETKRLAQVQRAVLGYRARNYDRAIDRERVVADLLDAARAADMNRLLGSPSTIHVSAVDNSGLACSITTSAGYGSGVMIPGTGLWLNNSLGEIELAPEGAGLLEPGQRTPSNMAPTLARRSDGAVLSIGSPGASRITTSIAQVLLNFIHLGMSLSDAVSHPRLHVELFEGRPSIAYEPGVAIEAFDDLQLRRFPDLSMYFGGVAVALWDPAAGLFQAADPRRSGGVAVGGT